MTTAKGGRPAIPTALRVIHGRNLTHKKLNRKEPKPYNLIPPMPDYLALEPEAVKLWEKGTQILFRLGLITEADGEMFAVYCYQYAVARRCARIVKRRGMYVRTPSGYLMTHPAVADGRKAQLVMATIAREFGFTPSARTRLTGAPLAPGEQAKSIDLTLGGLLDYS